MQSDRFLPLLLQFLFTWHFVHWHSHKRVLLLHTFNSLFSRTTLVRRYQKDKTGLDWNDARDDAVLEWQWHQLDHTQTICILLQTDNHNNTSSLDFYRPDALPDTQPTVSKHWRHKDAIVHVDNSCAAISSVKVPKKRFSAMLVITAACLQCFDAVGWAAGRASGL